MTMTVDGNFITYNDGTTQQSGAYRVIDGNSATSASAFNIGTYFLVDTQIYSSRTNPIPLDGWGRTYSGPCLNGNGALYNGNVGYIQPFLQTSATGYDVIYAGTWVSRGSGLSQAFVVRVA